jgi:parallel beta-helix repeat protein
MPTVNLSALAGAGQQFFDNNGNVLSGGKLWSYAAGTTTPQATYTSASGATAHTNPIVLDSAGRVATGEIWLTAGQNYKFVLMTSVNVTLATWDNITGINGTGITSNASNVEYDPPFTGAVTSGYTVEDKLRQVISVLDFIPDGTNTSTTDCAAFIQAAVTAAASKSLYIPAGTYRINTTVNLPNFIEVYGDGRATVIKQGTAAISGFLASAKTDVIVRDLTVLGELTTTAAYTGGVYFYNSSRCKALNVTCIGMTWAGIYLQNSNNCVVQGCSFSGFLGSVSDSADIMLYENCNYNVITGNHCYGENIHGIMIQDPYTGSQPTGNIVTENEVGTHDGYGIAIYVALSTTTPYNSQSVIANNVIRGITGTFLAGASGAGIFIQGTSGVLVNGNDISNCCLSTTNFETLGIAAISASLGEYGTGTTIPITISNNKINAQRGPGIYTLASERGCLINGNTIYSTGVSAVRGEAIISSNSQHTVINNNMVYHVNPNYYAIRVTSIDAEYSFHQISNNNVQASGGGGIALNISGTGFSQNCLVQGNTVWAASNPAYFLQKSDYLRFANNYGSSSGIVLFVQSCLNVRYSGNILFSGSGGYGITFSGTNTNSIADESNSLNTTVDNQAGNGTIISKYGNAGPSGSGSWAVGDRVIQSVPVVGQPKGWRCTVAGNPGTWVSEGNL